MPTKEQIKALAHPVKLKVRVGDRVQITTGKDKGQIGFVARVLPKKQSVVVLRDNPDNPDMPLPLNVVIKHRKARMQNEKSARIAMPSPIHISNVMVLDPKTGEPTRVGRKKNEEGKLVRYAKKSGETIHDVKASN